MKPKRRDQSAAILAFLRKGPKSLHQLEGHLKPASEDRLENALRVLRIAGTIRSIWFQDRTGKRERRWAIVRKARARDA